jgi:osmotically-inducible protein OsmY
MQSTHPQWLSVAENAGRHLHSRLDGFSNQISCEYRDGVLYLRGQSRSFYQKQMAQETVRKIDGVARVVNEIEVVSNPLTLPSPTQGEGTSDSYFFADP